MEIKLTDLESTLKKIKKYGKVNINTVPLFDEYYKPKDEQDDSLLDIYNNIQINDDNIKIDTEPDNDFLSFSTPPELFIKNDLLNNNSEVLIKEKKTEEKSKSMLDFISKDTHNNFSVCQLNECLSLPEIFRQIVEDYESFYRYGVMKQFSFLHSLMCIIDPMYGSYTLQNKKSEIDCLYNKLLFEFPKMYDKYNYRKFGYKKGIFQSKLSSDKKTDRSVQRYVSNYFNINILVVKIKYQKYYICGDFDPNILSVIMINYEDTFEPLLNQNGTHYFKDALSLLEKEFTLEPSEEKKIMEISTSSEEEKQLKIKLLKKKKASEIYELCEKLDIKLEVGLGKKKKKKDDLIAEIVSCMD